MLNHDVTDLKSKGGCKDEREEVGYRDAPAYETKKVPGVH